MIKSELVRRLAERRPHQLFAKDADRFVDVFLGEIEAALVRGNRVELRGFGAFTVERGRRPARRARNPKNRAFVDVREKRHPVFKMGKQMLAKLNPTPLG
jgi:integration host factor subunit beta